MSSGDVVTDLTVVVVVVVVLVGVLTLPDKSGQVGTDAVVAVVVVLIAAAVLPDMHKATQKMETATIASDKPMTVMCQKCFKFCFHFPAAKVEVTTNNPQSNPDSASQLHRFSSRG